MKLGILLVLVLLTAAQAEAALFLRQSTASQAVKLGPFVDSTDGNTEKTALTIANTDVHLSKNGGTIVAKNSGGCVHDANGFYTCTFDATDTNTVGTLQVYVHVTGALAVTEDFTVLPAVVYDSLIAGSDNLQVDVVQFGGTNGTFTTGEPTVRVSSGTGTGQMSLSSGAVTVGTNNDKTGYALSTAGLAAFFTTNSGSNYASSVAGSVVKEIADNAAAGAGVADSRLGIIDSGTAQSATATTLQLRAAASFADDEIIGATCVITGGTTGVGQARVVTDYVGATDTATVDAWTTTPTGTITYSCFGTAPGAPVTLADGAIKSTTFASDSITATALAASARDEIVDQTWDELLSGHGTAGSAGAALTNAGAGTNPWDVPVSGHTGVGSFGGLLNTQLDAAISTRMASFALPANFSSLAISGAGAVTAGTVADKTGYSLATAPLDAAGVRAAVGLASPNLDTQLASLPTAAEISAQVLADQRVLSGTCDSGTTTTCVDNALTQAATSQLDDRLICFDDAWCALITDFTPSTDTVTTTKVAPTTRAGKAYTIFPATAQ